MQRSIDVVETLCQNINHIISKRLVDSEKLYAEITRFDALANQADTPENKGRILQARQDVLDAVKRLHEECKILDQTSNRKVVLS